MKGADLDRRTFLTRTGLLLAALFPAVGTLVSCGSSRSDPATRRSLALAGALLDGPADPTALEPLGRAYLERHPEHRDPVVLARALCAGCMEAERNGPPEAAALRAQLREQQRQDFREGRTLELSGWLVSVTEARTAALSQLP